MFRVEIKIFVCLLSFCVACRADDLSPGDVFDLLSRRIDDVIVETRSIKSELAETKLAVSKIENKIENIEEKISNLGTNTDLEERIEANIVQEVMKFKDNAKTEVHEKLNRQKAMVHKMLSVEKTLLRDKIEQFDEKYSTFEADIKSKLTQMNKTMDQFVDHVNEINEEHKLDTNFSIMFLKTDFQLMLKDEDLKIEELIEKTERKIEKTKTEITNSTDTNLQEMKEIIDETSTNLKKEISDVTETFSNTNSHLQNSISGVSNRMNNAESRLNSAESTDRQLSSKLNSIERNQNTKDSNLDSRISQLSSKVSGLGARKVAFSARQSMADIIYLRNEIIVFDSVIYSYGGGFSSSAGIFTAPKSGTYLFTFNIQASNKGKAHVVLMIDGTLLTRAIAKGNDDNGGNAAVYYLWKGDKAFVQTAGLEDIFCIYPYRTTFNGVLID